MKLWRKLKRIVVKSKRRLKGTVVKLKREPTKSALLINNAKQRCRITLITCQPFWWTSN